MVVYCVLSHYITYYNFLFHLCSVLSLGHCEQSDVVYKYGCIFNELTLFPLVLRPTVELKNYNIVPLFFFKKNFLQELLYSYLYVLIYIIIKSQKCMKTHFSQYLLSLIYIIIASLTEVKCYPVWF